MSFCASTKCPKSKNEKAVMSSNDVIVGQSAFHMDR